MKINWWATVMILFLAYITSLLLAPLAFAREIIRNISTWNFFGWTPFAPLAVMGWFADFIIYAIIFLILYYVGRMFYR